MRHLTRPLAVFALLAAALGCGQKESAMKPATATSSDWSRPSDAELAAKLTPMQFAVTQKNGTEPPFMNDYWDNHEPGLYVDITTGEPLFSSDDKFDSGTGWPSFTKPVDPTHVVAVNDVSHGMIRVEVRSRRGNAHLGHVFPDGPREHGGLRYCMNSAALRFIPAAELDAQGYGAWKHTVKAAGSTIAADHDNTCAATDDGTPGCATSYETAYLAGGCFWGMEDILRDVPGILETEVGYTGGHTPNPTYEQIKTGRTGHAEAVRIVFDPAVISYADLLDRWFFKMHDPTTLNRQGNDIGTSYRSAIFTTTPEQARVAAEVKAKMDASGFWKSPIVTEIVPAGPWTAAEEYHQDYLEKHPGGYTCHFMRE